MRVSHTRSRSHRETQASLVMFRLDVDIESGGGSISYRCGRPGPISERSRSAPHSGWAVELRQVLMSSLQEPPPPPPPQRLHACSGWVGACNAGCGWEAIEREHVVCPSSLSSLVAFVQAETMHGSLCGRRQTTGSWGHRHARSDGRCATRPLVLHFDSSAPILCDPA